GDVSRAEMIVTFLALLEMTKLRMTHLSQEDPLGPIMIELRVREDDDPSLIYDDGRPCAARADEGDSTEPGVDADDDVLARRPSSGVGSNGDQDFDAADEFGDDPVGESSDSLLGSGEGASDDAAPEGAIGVDPGELMSEPDEVPVEV